MSKTLENVCLLEKMLDNGLSFVAAYLQKKLGRPIIIADNIGYTHYPTKECSLASDDLFVTIPPKINKKGYYYCETDGILFYQVGQNATCANIIVKNLPKDQIAQAIEVIAEARLAIKSYFINNDNVRNNNEKFKKKFIEDLFINDMKIKSIIKMSEFDLDINTLYVIKLVQVDEVDNKIDLNLLRSYTFEYFKRIDFEIIPICWDECLMFIIPLNYKEDTLEIDYEWPKLIDGVKWKNALYKRFNIVVSTGLGQAYKLRDLHKSYNEARFAITLPKLMGQKGFTKKFSDLGVFTHILSQDIEGLNSYCLKNLGGLIEYDRKNETELLPTLRIMLDNCNSWKLTAGSLFIHVNTLHYRMEKIEQILNVDLNQMNSRVNLFTSIKVLDTLTTLGMLEL